MKGPKNIITYIKYKEQWYFDVYHSSAQNTHNEVTAFITLYYGEHWTTLTIYMPHVGKLNILTLKF
jgi:hypothetical protein